MKKYFLTLIILTLTLFSPIIVKADVIVDTTYQDYLPTSTFTSSFDNLYFYNDFNSFISDYDNKIIFDELYNDIISYYNENYKETHPYYVMSVQILSKSSSQFDLAGVYIYMRIVDNSSYMYSSWQSSTYSYQYIVSAYFNNTYYSSCIANDLPINKFVFLNPFPFYNSNYLPLNSFQNNLASYYSGEYVYNNIDYNLYENDSLKFSLTENSLIPTIMSSTYEDYSSSNYTTVDLSKYHYVLLNLKDYSQKEPFSSNLQVKGMVGITPIYNYGTTAKDDVIGNKIEDRCNLSYKDYTDHRLYIIKSDLENKAIYAVKGCEDNSSFKFDNSVFDITYVTDDNINDAIVTIDGKEYHTIPYNQLPSTATKNEEENYIPGESKELSFSEIVDNVTDTLSSVWSSIITFMNLFTKFFNTLPVEIRVISITTFTTACTLGIIKILKA